MQRDWSHDEVILMKLIATSSLLIVVADAGGPLALAVDFDSDDIPEADYADLASGSFKVSVSGPAAATFEAANADADLLMRMTFSAFE